MALRGVASSLVSGLSEGDKIWTRYSRGSDSVELLAVPGESRHQVETEDGSIRTVNTKDWLYVTADLAFYPGDTPIVPSRGQDIIEELDGEGGDVVRTYLVTHPAGGEPYRYMSQYRDAIRVQTVQRGS